MKTKTISKKLLWALGFVIVITILFALMAISSSATEYEAKYFGSFAKYLSVGNYTANHVDGDTYIISLDVLGKVHPIHGDTFVIPQCVTYDGKNAYVDIEEDITLYIEDWDEFWSYIYYLAIEPGVTLTLGGWNSASRTPINDFTDDFNIPCDYYINGHKRFSSGTQKLYFGWGSKIVDLDGNVLYGGGVADVGYLFRESLKLETFDGCLKTFEYGDNLFVDSTTLPLFMPYVVFESGYACFTNSFNSYVRGMSSSSRAKCETYGSSATVDWIGTQNFTITVKIDDEVVGSVDVPITAQYSGSGSGIDFKLYYAGSSQLSRLGDYCEYVDLYNAATGKLFYKDYPTNLTFSGSFYGTIDSTGAKLPSGVTFDVLGYDPITAEMVLLQESVSPGDRVNIYYNVQTFTTRLTQIPNFSADMLLWEDGDVNRFTVYGNCYDFFARQLNMSLANLGITWMHACSYDELYEIPHDESAFFSAFYWIDEIDTSRFGFPDVFEFIYDYDRVSSYNGSVTLHDGYFSCDKYIAKTLYDDLGNMTKIAYVGCHSSLAYWAPNPNLDLDDGWNFSYYTDVPEWDEYREYRLRVLFWKEIEVVSVPMREAARRMTLSDGMGVEFAFDIANGVNVLSNLSYVEVIDGKGNVFQYDYERNGFEIAPVTVWWSNNGELGVVGNFANMLPQHLASKIVVHIFYEDPYYPEKGVIHGTYEYSMLDYLTDVMQVVQDDDLAELIEYLTVYCWAAANYSGRGTSFDYEDVFEKNYKLRISEWLPVVRSLWELADKRLTSNDLVKNYSIKTKSLNMIDTNDENATYKFVSVCAMLDTQFKLKLRWTAPIGCKVTVKIGDGPEVDYTERAWRDGVDWGLTTDGLAPFDFGKKIVIRLYNYKGIDEGATNRTVTLTTDFYTILWMGWNSDPDGRQYNEDNGAQSAYGLLVTAIWRYGELAASYIDKE